jgi:4-hydroxyphenylpyruvate dioxygenase
MKNNDIVFSFTAPYSSKTDKSNSKPPLPYDVDVAHGFLKAHGLAVRALGIRVDDAEKAYHLSVENGAVAVQSPVKMQGKDGSMTVISEVSLYGNVVLRYVSGDYSGPYLPGYEAVTDVPTVDYGLERIDHAVGNVPELLPAVNYIMGFTGFHEFAEFVAEDVGTVDSGLNSMVLASNNEMVLIPVNEPTFNTPRKSQIQTFLEQNEGAGLQHLALKTDDIFRTLTEMRNRSHYGGFEFMPKPSQEYYDNLPKKIGPFLTPKQFKLCEELGLLVDKDDQGVLLQIFTKPVGDRSTFFFEIIQRICIAENAEKKPEIVDKDIAGCGGFGKGNFTELFKSIEVYETELGIN